MQSHMLHLNPIIDILVNEISAMLTVNVYNQSEASIDVTWPLITNQSESFYKARGAHFSSIKTSQTRLFFIIQSSVIVCSTSPSEFFYKMLFAMFVISSIL